MRRSLLVLTLLGAAACTDYRLKGTNDAALGDTGPQPEISVDPPDGLLGVVCEGDKAQFVVSSVGEAPLTVRAITVEGEGWEVIGGTEVVVLDPGDTLLVQVRAGEGPGVLTLTSDDPDAPTVSLPLDASFDTAPTIRDMVPEDGAVIPAGEGLHLQAVVSDDLDAPDALSVVWSSSALGLLSTTPPDASGLTSTDLAAASTPDGGDTLTLTVTDTCGNTTALSRSVCFDDTYSYAPLDLTSWHYEGVARFDSVNGWLELTDTSPNVVGTAFETSTAVSADNVTMNFRFYLYGGTGADGISLTALDVNRMTTFLGGTGCGLGYGGDAPCTAGPALPGWTIEVDTYYNGGADPTEDDHVAFTFDGDVDNPAAWAALPELEVDAWHDMSVEVRAPRVRVTLDGTAWIDQDIAGYYAFPAYVGFTASTGGETNYHRIQDLLVTGHTCE